MKHPFPRPSRPFPRPSRTDSAPTSSGNFFPALKSSSVVSKLEPPAPPPIREAVAAPPIFRDIAADRAGGPQPFKKAKS